MINIIIDFIKKLNFAYKKNLQYKLYLIYSITTGVVIIQREISSLNQIDLPCWKYFKCSESSKKTCKAYRKGFRDDNFRECWLFINDNLNGGPEKNGPCASCEWLLKYTSNFSIQ